MGTVPYRDSRDAIARNVWTREQVEREQQAWPNLASTPRWRHDPDAGLVERSYAVPAAGWEPNGGGPRPVGLTPGVRGSAVFATVTEQGWRRRLTDGAAPRINTYGDSYTHCDQVNDGETWQEYLAAHIGEPIGNYGLGGGSVHQTYLRMTNQEVSEHAAEHVLFYLWGDDHLRSVLGFVRIAIGTLLEPGIPLAIGNPMLRWNASRQEFVEQPTWLRSPEDLERLADPAWLEHQFADNVALQLCLFGGHPADYEPAQRIELVDDALVGSVADSFGIPWDRTREGARAILDRLSLEASISILERARGFAARHSKKIMFLLLDPFRSVRQLLEGETRYDQQIVDHLAATGAEFFDMTKLHAEQIRAAGGSFEDFHERFFVDRGYHYSAVGNHHFAFTLKDRVVEWLDPRPVAYRQIIGESTDELFAARFPPLVEPSGSER